MNEEEYLKARIKCLEDTVSNKKLPIKIRLNQLKALENYKNELEILQNKLF